MVSFAGDFSKEERHYFNILVPRKWSGFTVRFSVERYHYTLIITAWAAGGHWAFSDHMPNVSVHYLPDTIAKYLKEAERAFRKFRKEIITSINVTQNGLKLF